MGGVDSNESCHARLTLARSRASRLGSNSSERRGPNLLRTGHGAGRRCSTLAVSDLGDVTLLPGLIDCHQHLVFGTERARDDRESRLDQRAVHGFTTSTPTSAKSSTFLVATVASWLRQIAAICASAMVIGRPIRSRSTTMSA